LPVFGMDAFRVCFHVYCLLNDANGWLDAVQF
jgi:hypothetical protein